MKFPWLSEFIKLMCKDRGMPKCAAKTTFEEPFIWQFENFDQLRAAYRGETVEEYRINKESRKKLRELKHLGMLRQNYDQPE